jgi:hypothetical protein
VIRRRPRGATSRDCAVLCRFTRTELHLVDSVAGQFGLARGALLRAAALAAIVTAVNHGELR